MRAFEIQRQCWLTIDNPVIVPKDQAMLKFLHVTEKFTEGQNTSIMALTPEGKKVKMVLCFPVMYDLDDLT